MKALFQISNRSRWASCFWLGLLVITSNCKPPNDKARTQKIAEVSPLPTIQHIDSISVAAALLPEFKTDPHSTNSQGNQISGVVRTVFQDHEGSLWFGTQNGLCRFKDQLYYFDLKSALGESITVMDIAEDADRNLWIAHSGGITKFDGIYFTNYTKKDGLKGDDAWTITVDHKNRVWVSTMEGLSYFDGKNFTPFTLPEAQIDTTHGISSPYIVHVIAQDKDDNLWFGTNKGAYRYDNFELYPLTLTDGLCGEKVNNIVIAGQDTYWFTTLDHGICRFRKGEFIDYTQKAGIGGQTIWSAIEDSKKQLWFSVKGVGVYRYDGQNFRLFNQDDGLAHLTTFEVYEDQKGRIWAVGFGGAYRLDDDRFINVSREGPW